MNIKTLMFASLLIFLNSCEGETTYEKYVQNNTIDTITVSMHIGNEQHTAIILPNGRKLFPSPTFGLGAKTQTTSCLIGIDTITVSSSSGKILTKNILLDENWKATLERKGPGLSHQECLFTIEASDLQ